ncbi:hypothetical protein WAI453_004142 [Rhynchosporium graminicola]
MPHDLPTLSKPVLSLSNIKLTTPPSVSRRPGSSPDHFSAFPGRAKLRCASKPKPSPKELPRNPVELIIGRSKR